LHFRLLLKSIDEVFKCPFRINRVISRQVPANWATLLFLVLKGMSVDTLIAGIHHIVIKVRVSSRRDLESFIAARSGNDGVCRSDGWDDIFNYALSQRICDTRNIKLLGSPQCLLVDPLDMLRIIIIQLFIYPTSQPSTIPTSLVRGRPNIPSNTLGHSRMLAHSIQCAGCRGIVASVHIATAVWGVSISKEHS